jgi:hypothetical protein
VFEAYSRYYDAVAGFQCLAGDIRTVQLGCTFDAVLSLFHVVSYQIGNADVQAVDVSTSWPTVRSGPWA